MKLIELIHEKKKVSAAVCKDPDPLTKGEVQLSLCGKISSNGFNVVCWFSPPPPEGRQLLHTNMGCLS